MMPSYQMNKFNNNNNDDDILFVPIVKQCNSIKGHLPVRLATTMILLLPKSRFPKIRLHMVQETP